MRALIFLLVLAAVVPAQLPGSIKVAVNDDWHHTYVPFGREIVVEAHATLQGNESSVAEISAGIKYGKRGVHELEPERIVSRKTIVRIVRGVTMIDVKIKAVFLVPTYYPGNQITWYVDALHPKTRVRQGSASLVDLIEGKK